MTGLVQPAAPGLNVAQLRRLQPGDRVRFLHDHPHAFHGKAGEIVEIRHVSKDWINWGTHGSLSERGSDIHAMKGMLERYEDDLPFAGYDGVERHSADEWILHLKTPTPRSVVLRRFAGWRAVEKPPVVVTLPVSYASPGHRFASTYSAMPAWAKTAAKAASVQYLTDYGLLVHAFHQLANRYSGLPKDTHPWGLELQACLDWLTQPHGMAWVWITGNARHPGNQIAPEMDLLNRIGIHIELAYGYPHDIQIRGADHGTT